MQLEIQKLTEREAKRRKMMATAVNPGNTGNTGNTNSTSNPNNSGNNNPLLKNNDLSSWVKNKLTTNCIIF
jgi:hypothetical protein